MSTIIIEIDLFPPRYDYEAELRKASDGDLLNHHETMLAGWFRHRNTCDVLKNAAERDLKVINAEIKRRGL